MKEKSGARSKARSKSHSRSRSGSQSGSQPKSHNQSPQHRTTRSRSQSATPIATMEDSPMEEDNTECDAPLCTKTKLNYAITYLDKNGERTSAMLCWKCCRQYRASKTYREGRILSIDQTEEISSEEESEDEYYDEDREMLLGFSEAQCHSAFCTSNKPPIYIITIQRPLADFENSDTICEDCYSYYKDRTEYEGATIVAMEPRETIIVPMQAGDTSKALQDTQSTEMEITVTQNPKKATVVTHTPEIEPEVTQTQIGSEKDPKTDHNSDDMQEIVQSPTCLIPYLKPQNSPSLTQAHPHQILLSPNPDQQVPNW